jgi:chemotaxis protein CheZ
VSSTTEQRRPNDELKALRTHISGQAKEQDGADTIQSLKAELALIRDTVARNKCDLDSVIGDAKERRMARAAGELGAAVNGMEMATQKILKSVEIVDDSARALTASLKDEYKRGLAQDIQDHVVKIYEACNFQDIAGQRIGKVIVTLTAIEEQVAAILARCNEHDVAAQSLPAAKPSAKCSLLNGPKFDGDPGHATQHDIDKMFG